MLHQTGVTDLIDPAAGGYAGTQGLRRHRPAGRVGPGRRAGRTRGVVGSLGSLSLAVDVAVSPDHQKVAVAVAGNAPMQGAPRSSSGSVQTVTAIAARPSCGSMGTGVATTPPPGPGGGGGLLAVGRAVRADARAGGALARGHRRDDQRWRRDSRADTGHLIFHANAGGGLACASCHPEGGEDGRVWNFVCAGARRTQSIRGGISETAPFHWDGSEHDFSR